MSEYKKNGKCKLLGVAGCLPQRYSEKLKTLLPEVDVFIGAGEFPKIVEILKSFKGKQSMHIDRPEYIYDLEHTRAHTTPKYISYLKIAEGCFHPCSFCIIPQIRGSFRSRTPLSIIEEAKLMIENGVKEIDIIAQDTTAYGRDVDSDISTLLEKLSSLNGDKWLRLLYTYPHNFPAELIDVIADHPDICKYIDMPIQHISDRILKAMNRGPSHEIKDLLREIRRRIPHVSLRTSLIVGFPGETQEDFDELLDFVCEEKFEHLGVFVFSPEEGTKAFKLKNWVDREVAEKRRNEIMNVQREISSGNNRRYIGKKVRVLVEGSSTETDMLLQGRHEGQAPEIDGVVFINEGLAASGDFATVLITDAHEYDLVGKIVG